MGLDMHLVAKRYVSTYDIEDAKYIEGIKALGFDILGDMEPMYVVFEAMYWRKANAIHQWFVKNVQDGVDNCAEYYVGLDELKELRDTCQQVLDDNSKAQELLPPQSGFFFGSTEIDEWYIQNLEDTVQRIDELLELNGTKDYRLSFYYSSSW